MPTPSPASPLRHAWHRLRGRIPDRLLARVAIPLSRLAPAGLGLGTLLRLAVDLEDAGEYRLALGCWRAVHRMAPADTRIVTARFRCALEAGDTAELDRLAGHQGGGNGIPPRQLVSIAGQLANEGRWGTAVKVLHRLAAMPNAGRMVVQSPSIVSPDLPAETMELVRRIEVAGDSPGAWLLLARLCFTLRNPDVSAALYRAVCREHPLPWRDRVAMFAAAAQAGMQQSRAPREELAGLVRQAAGNPDALGMLAYAALFADEEPIAREAIALALDACDWVDATGKPRVVQDCLAIVGIVAALRRRPAELPSTVLQKGVDKEAGIPKVFLCGFGWSGSGALYDDVRATPGFCEFEGAGDESIVNEDAGSEVTFIQGSSGLGLLWIRAQQEQRIPWSAFWDLFSYHVLGLSPVGYDLYKSCNAARNNLRRHGAGYVRPFHVLMERYLGMLESPRAGGLQSLLLDATESLCAMLVERTGSKAVLFNNAVFGRNAAMLEIFRSHRAAVVYRDPRDVYVDRRTNDRNHWRTARELATFYALGLRNYCAYRRSQRANDTALREVSFERFVKDASHRACVREWLCAPLGRDPVTGHFDPRVSEANIGLHVGALDPDESRYLASAMSGYQEMERLSATWWGGQADPWRTPVATTA